MTTAVVTLAQGRHPHLLHQQRSLGAGDVLPDLYVVVAIDDPWIEQWRPTDPPHPRVVAHASTPRGLPLAAARNAGVAEALRLGADVVIGLDVDCLAGAGLVEAYAQAVRDEPDAVWTGPVTYLPPPNAPGYDLRRLDDWDAPHPARPDPGVGRRLGETDPDLFWSLSFAVHRDRWRDLGGFCEEYVGYGGEDTDFGHRAVAGGMRIAVTGSARAYHQHHAVESPPVRHLDDILRNGAVFAGHWGRWPMTGWLREFEALGLVRQTRTGWERTPAAADV